MYIVNSVQYVHDHYNEALANYNSILVEGPFIKGAYMNLTEAMSCAEIEAKEWINNVCVDQHNINIEKTQTQIRVTYNYKPHCVAVLNITIQKI